MYIAGKKYCQLRAGLECGGLPCARKLKLAVSMLSGSEDYNRFIVSISCINSSV